MEIKTYSFDEMRSSRSHSKDPPLLNIQVLDTSNHKNIEIGRRDENSRVMIWIQDLQKPTELEIQKFVDQIIAN